MPSRILPLPEDAISQIQSSKQITSLQGVVLALLENALDADASKVDVAVNFSRGSCALEDNGTGITSSEFLERGGLGKIYHTSKATPASTVHGSTGTYLSSLAALSLLSITSRHLTEDVSATLSMHQGRVIVRHVPAQHANEMLVFATHGTRVTINDLFGNMPVRVKQRALLSAQGSTTDERQWLELKRGVAALLLAWPKPCSVKLKDSESPGRNVTLSGSHSTVSSSLTEKNLNRLHGRETQYDLRDALAVLFQAGLASLDTRKHWVPVSASTSKLSCRGMICLAPSPTRLCQFVSIGVQPCSASSGHSSVYEAINKTFSNSSFGTVDESVRADAIQKTRSSHEPRTVSQGPSLGQLRTSKGVDRWPMFVLQLRLKDQNEGAKHNTDDNQLKAIVEILEAMVQQWLVANNFRPRQRRRLKTGNRRGSDSEPTSPARSERQRLFGVNDAGSSASPHFISPTRDTPSAVKRRRLVTQSDRTRTSRDTVIGKQQASEVVYLSKIRSGQRHSITPVTAEGSRGGYPEHVTTAQGEAGFPTARFALPPLEPGELSTFSNTANAARATSEPLPHPTSDHSHRLSAQLSEDFGSISDTDLMKAADTWEEPSHDQPPVESGTSAQQETSRDEVVDWMDPVTRGVLRVNTRTGAVLPIEIRPGSSARRDIRTPSATSNMARTSAGRPLTLAKRSGPVAEGTPRDATPSFLEDWQNPVFKLQSEQSIPVASLLGQGTELSNLSRNRHSHAEALAYFEDAGHGTQNKLSKASLLRVKVIRQIDSKFILCSMPNTNEITGVQTLVLVDQHAASERVILESLLSELCSPIDPTAPAASFRANTGCSPAVTTVFLEQPVVFEITSEESKLLRSHAPHFAQYGILYDLHATSQTRQHHCLATLALPPGIAERCRLFPKLPIDLLRGEIWSRVEAGKQSTNPTAVTRDFNDDHHPWLTRLGTCPKGLLDMLNSRACRSAVMFNDILSQDECRDLLRQLRDCAFPFMCAHGRVSMVPVGELEGTDVGAQGTSNSEGLGQRARGSSEGYLDAFRKWKTRESS